GTFGPRSSSGPGHRPLKAETIGSNPIRGTTAGVKLTAPCRRSKLQNLPAAEILEEEARCGANAAGTFLEEFAVQGARDDHGQRRRHSSDQPALPGGVLRCGVRAEKA